MSHGATAAALLALVLFSISTIAARLASERVDSELGFTVAMLVNAFVSGASMLVVLALRGEAFTLDTQAAVLFVLAGLCSTLLGRWFFFEAVRRLGAARALICGRGGGGDLRAALPHRGDA